MQNNKDKNRGTKIQYSDVLYIGLCLCVITRSALTLPTRFVFLLIKEQRENVFQLLIQYKTIVISGYQIRSGLY